MELIIFIAILIASFCFVVYIPTTLFLRDVKVKRKGKENLLTFIAFSLMFLLLSYICVGFYSLKSVGEVTECSVLSNMNCLFYDTLPRVIRPDLSIYMVLLTQLILMVAYAYYTVKKIMEYNNKVRVATNLFIFFFVAIVASILHYFVLYDSAFVSGLKYITLFSANAYIILPFMYLVIITYVNRDQLKSK